MYIMCVCVYVCVYIYILYIYKIKAKGTPELIPEGLGVLFPYAKIYISVGFFLRFQC
jgi:hypothetical protein